MLIVYVVNLFEPQNIPMLYIFLYHFIYNETKSQGHKMSFSPLCTFSSSQIVHTNLPLH